MQEQIILLSQLLDYFNRLIQSGEAKILIESYNAFVYVSNPLIPIFFYLLSVENKLSNIRMD